MTSPSPRTYILHALHIQNFGAFHEKDVGPFSPGLTIVYGSNEAGKTTIRQFIGSILFGWPKGGSRTNSYSNTSGDRAGTLSFLPRSSAENNSASYDNEIRITRTSKRSQQNDSVEESGLLDDIDKTTFDNVFSLDTDELMDLKSGDKLTSRFLSASADTTVSPSQAHQDVEKSIKDCFSRSQSDEFKHSIPNLKDELAQVRQKLEEAETQRHQLFDDRVTYKNLEREEKRLQQHLTKLQAAEKKLVATQTNLNSWNDQQKKLDRDTHALHDQQDELGRQRDAFAHENAGYPEKNDNDIARMRKDIRELRKRSERSEEALQDAKAHREDSFVRLQTMKNKIDKVQSNSVSRRTQRLARRALPSILAVVLIAVGAFTFSLGRIQSSISITGLGIFILAVAFAGLVMLFVANRRPKSQTNRLAVLQNQLDSDQTTFDRGDALVNLKQKDFDAAKQEIIQWIDASGLGERVDSLDEVETILDTIEHINKTCHTYAQRQQSLDVQLAQIQQRQAELDDMHRSILRAFEDADINDSTADLEQKLSNAIDRVSEELRLTRDERSQNLRYIGQLNERFSHATNDNELADLRLKAQKLTTKLNDARHHLAVLLIAEQILSIALSKWESQSSPDVYKRAGQLLKEMTQGTWDHIQVDDSGKIQAITFSGKATKPIKMSLGARQQLYLSLRLALLHTATDVGKNVPVLCDDILVNFDETRRAGAAQALVSLAKKRQVIVFTCHKDVVELLHQLNPSATEISL